MQIKSVLCYNQEDNFDSFLDRMISNNHNLRSGFDNECSSLKISQYNNRNNSKCKSDKWLHRFSSQHKDDSRGNQQSCSTELIYKFTESKGSRRSCFTDSKCISGACYTDKN